MEIPLTLNSHAQLLWTSVRRKTTKSAAAPEERKLRSWSRGGGGGGLCLNRVALISINFAVGPRLLSPQYSVLSLTKRRKGPFAGEYLSVLYLHPCYLCSLECTNYVKTEYYLYVPGEMLQYNLRTTGIPLESPDSGATRSWSTYQEMKLFNHTNYATFPGLFLYLSLWPVFYELAINVINPAALFKSWNPISSQWAANNVFRNWYCKNPLQFCFKV